MNMDSIILLENSGGTAFAIICILFTLYDIGNVCNIDVSKLVNTLNSCVILCRKT